MSELNFMHENISGIYDYCDRWCEKCSYTNKCLLFKREAERNIKHVLRDEDPNNPKVYSKDIAESFQEAYNLLLDKMGDEEIDEDLSEMVEEELNDFIYELKEETSETKLVEDFNRPYKDNLVNQTEKFFKDFYNYYEKINTICTIGDKSSLSADYKKIQLEIAGWYAPQIYVKTRMCLLSKKKIAKPLNQTSREVELEIYNVNCRIAYAGICKTISALEEISKISLQNYSFIPDLLKQMNEIKDNFVIEYPNVLVYKRPYFD